MGNSHGIGIDPVYRVERIERGGLKPQFGIPVFHLSPGIDDMDILIELVSPCPCSDGGVLSFGVDDEHGVVVSQQGWHDHTGPLPGSGTRHNERMGFRKRRNGSSRGFSPKLRKG